MDDKATVCLECKLHQSRFWNSLPYIGGIGAFLAVFASAIIWGCQAFQSLSANRFGTVDLRVVAIKSHSEAVFENAGGRDVFVACINFDSPYAKETWPINRVVHAGQFEVVTGPDSRDGIDYRCIRGKAAKLIQEGKAVVQNQEQIYYTSDHAALLAHYDWEDHAICQGKAVVIYRPLGELKTQKGVDVGCTAMFVQRAGKNGEFADKVKYAGQKEFVSLPVAEPGTLETTKTTTSNGVSARYGPSGYEAPP